MVNCLLPVLDSIGHFGLDSACMASFLLARLPGAHARIDKAPDFYGAITTDGHHPPAIGTEDGSSDRAVMLQSGFIYPCAVGMPTQDYCRAIGACGH